MNQNTTSEWIAMGRDVLDIEMQGLRAVYKQLDSSFVGALEILAMCDGRVVLTGLGKSGLVARKIAATLSSTGTPAFYLHPVEGAHGDIGMLRKEDVLLAISNSGETDELNALLPSLRTLGLRIIGMTGNLSSSLAHLSDMIVNCHVPREACPLDLAPTASTTATLAMGDALAMCLMRLKSIDEKDFKRVHPGGALGQRLKLRVTDLMHISDLPVARKEASVQEGLAILDKGKLGALFVTDMVGKLDGILTDGDVRRLACKGALDMDQPLASLMITHPATAGPEQSVAELLDVMEARAITVLPVVDGANTLIGVVHLHDLLGKGQLRFSG